MFVTDSSVELFTSRHKQYIVGIIWFDFYDSMNRELKNLSLPLGPIL